MFVKAYLDAAAAVIATYTGTEPLAAFLKKFFAPQKKFGSRDRRHISHLVYCYFRLGRSVPHLPVPDRLLAGLFLCSQPPQPVLQQLRPEWHQKLDGPLAKKMAFLAAEIRFNPEAIFPYPQHLSPAIEQESFHASFLVQPDTYLRLRPGQKEKVLHQLQAAHVPYRELGGDALAVPPAAKLDTLLMLDRQAVVQDWSSQQVLSLLQPFFQNGPSFTAWDCCAASGGKSLLLHDRYPQAQLTVSDIRPSILSNLRKRFAQAGIQNYQWFVGDLSLTEFQYQRQFDLVLCDAPCSGSGTWGRTPEWLLFFEENKIAHYAGLQQRIAQKAAGNVKKGGFFLYITCSVFSAENEAMVQHLQHHAGLEAVDAQYFKGYQQKADTLFAALFRKR